MFYLPKENQFAEHDRMCAENREKLARQQQYRYRIGDIGEKYVLLLELQKLENSEFAELVRDCTCNLNAHYDFLSYTPSGQEIIIEVKSTASKNPYEGFHMSRKALEVAWDFYKQGKRYEIHRVYDVYGDIRRKIIPAEHLFSKKNKFRASEYSVLLDSTAQMFPHLSGDAARAS